MADLLQRTEVLAPHYLKVLKLEIEQPSRALRIIPNLIRSTFKVTSTNFFEDHFKWDNTSEDNAFFDAWRGKYGYDERTTLWVDIKAQGVQNEKNKKGSLTVWLRAYLITKLTYSNFIHKAILRVYSSYFYSDQRRKYSEEVRRNMDILEKELKTQLGVS
jgi:hypothetical protein